MCAEDFVKAIAPAKVNLALRVGGRRADGYHQLDTVFEALDIFDEITAFMRQTPAITMEISGIENDLPTNSDNLVIRAAQLLQQKFHVKQGAHLVLQKKIPIAAGMAGGSADAAATCVALNQLWNLNLTQTQLCALAAQLGSDVPFALLGGIAHGTSRGEQLTPLTPRAMHGWVILANPQGLSTPQVFQKYDQLYPAAPIEPASTAQLRAALETGSLTELAACFANDLWLPAAQLRPDVAQMYDSLAGVGVGKILSGSGPSIAILCEVSQVLQLAKDLRAQFPQLSVHSAFGPAAGAHLVN